jgi:hypothetical protein
MEYSTDAFSSRMQSLGAIMDWKWTGNIRTHQSAIVLKETYFKKLGKKFRKKTKFNPKHFLNSD